MAQQRAGNVPKMRFQGFQCNWQIEPLLSRIAKIIDFRGRTPKKLGLEWRESGYLALSALNVKDGYIDRLSGAPFGDDELYDTWMRGNDLHKNQVLFTTEAPMGNVAQVPDSQRYILSQRTIAFVTETSSLSEDFLAVLLKSPTVVRDLQARASGGTAKGVSQKLLGSIDVALTDDLSEQTQIGAYFKSLDRTIGLHQRKHYKLVTLKQAMLQKMFPQDAATTPEIRFKGFDGEWEPRTLGSLGNTFSGLSGKTKDDFGHGSGGYVTYMSVFSNPFSDESMTGLVDIDMGQTEVNFGDVFFTTSSETPEDVGMSSVWVGHAENIYLNSFCFGFRPTSPVGYLFLAYALRSPEFRKSISFLAQGISRFNISKRKAMEIELLLPGQEEQNKIGAYFHSLDKLIAKHTIQLEKLKNIKSACLEKMFV